MFRANGLAFVILVKIGDSLSGGKDIIDGKGIKFVEIEVVVDVFESLNEQHGIFGFVLDVLGRLCRRLMRLLSFVIILPSSYRC